MGIEWNFENTFLSCKEIRDLRRLRRKKERDRSEITNCEELIRTGFVSLLVDHVDQGYVIYGNKVKVTDKFTRYMIYRRRHFMDSLITPIITSVITTAVLYTLQWWLLPALRSLLQGHP